MKYVVSVSKAYKHRGKHVHRTAKKHWHVYFYDEQGQFRTERVNLLKAFYYKTQKKHRYKFVCEECGTVFIGIVKSFKDKVECPYCLED